MEDASHPTSQTLRVERSVEWSRLEEQIMTLVYERLVPIVGARLQPERGLRRQAPSPETATGMQKRALGA